MFLILFSFLSDFFFFFVNYRLMIVKNFINAIKVFVRLSFSFSSRMRKLKNEKLVP